MGNNAKEERNTIEFTKPLLKKFTGNRTTIA